MKYLFSTLSLLFLVCTASLGYADTRVYFSPNGGCQQAVIAQIEKAHQSVDIAMYSFTSRGIAETLAAVTAKGVKVDVVLDKAQMKEHYSKGKFLLSKGIDVRFHLGPGLMHDKFAVIDGQVVMTGSFNWTTSADKKNSENLLVIKDKEIAMKYVKQFKLLWSQSGEGGIFKEGQSVGKE